MSNLNAKQKYTIIAIVDIIGLASPHEIIESNRQSYHVVSSIIRINNEPYGAIKYHYS